MRSGQINSVLFEKGPQDDPSHANGGAKSNWPGQLSSVLHTLLACWCSDGGLANARLIPHVVPLPQGQRLPGLWWVCPIPSPSIFPTKDPGNSLFTAQHVSAWEVTGWDPWLSLISARGPPHAVTVCSLHKACWAHSRRQSREEAQGGDSAVRWVRAPALSPLAVGPRIQGPGFLSSVRQGTPT